MTGRLSVFAGTIYVTVACSAVAADAPQVDFNRDIRPILSDTCYRCHGPDEGERQAELRLDLRESATGPREGYDPAIVPGKPEKSPLFERIASDDEFAVMPPPDSGKKLDQAQIELVRRWIAEGAAWQEHWAYVAPERPAVPEVKDVQATRTLPASGSLDAPVLALNHAVAALPPVVGDSPRLVAHCVDLEVLDECGEAVAARADYLLMPWMPNRDHRRGSETLADLCRGHALLRTLDAEGRLVWYDRAGSRLRGTRAAVPVRFFSAEGAFGVLARAGVRRIVTAGIDGGTEYAGTFAELRPLANGRATFDDQLPALEAIARRWHIAWRRF